MKPQFKKQRFSQLCIPEEKQQLVAKKDADNKKSTW